MLGLVACDAGTERSLADLDVSALAHDADALIGTWDLVTTTSPGFVSPPATTPAPAGELTYTFAADGSAVVERNYAEPRQTTWRLEPAGPSFPGAPPRLVVDEGRHYFGVDGDRLYIDYRPMDGPLYEFARR